MNELEVITNAGAIQQTRIISDDLYKRFLSYLDVSPRTVETYEKGIRQFMKYAQANGITQPERDDVIAWRDELKQSHKPTTVQGYLTAVKLFFQWMEQEGIYKNVADKIKGAKIQRGHKKDYLTSKQSKKVLEGIDTETMKGLRDYAIIATMITTGLRTIEVARADVRDLRTVGDSTALFIQGKGRDERTEYVKIAPQVEDALRAYLKARGAKQDEPLFTSTSNNNSGNRMTTRSISAIAKDSLTGAGFTSDRLTAHSLRHTAGTLALLNGADLPQVQQLLRHSNINTTMIYMHALDRAKNDSEIKVANAIF